MCSVEEKHIYRPPILHLVGVMYNNIGTNCVPEATQAEKSYMTSLQTNGVCIPHDIERSQKGIELKIYLLICYPSIQSFTSRSMVGDVVVGIP